MTRPTVLGAWGNGAQTTTLGVTIPAGTLATGDSLIFLGARDTTGTDTISFAEAGWDETNLGNLNFTNGNTKCGTRIAESANASDLTYSLSLPSSRGVTGLIIAVRGHPTTPIAASGAQVQVSGSTTTALPSRIIGANESLYIGLAGYTQAYGSPLTPPTDHTIQGQFSFTTTQDCYVWVSSFNADTTHSPVAASYTHPNSVQQGKYSLVFGPYTASTDNSLAHAKRYGPGRYAGPFMR